MHTLNDPWRFIKAGLRPEKDLAVCLMTVNIPVVLLANRMRKTPLLSGNAFRPTWSQIQPLLRPAV
jgi:hypothetical protein